MGAGEGEARRWGVAEIVLLAGAEAEIIHLYSACEDRQPGRGDRFRAEVEHVLELLAVFPFMGFVFERPYYRAKLSRFPFSIIYSVEGDRIMVQSVASDYEPREALRRRLG